MYLKLNKILKELSTSKYITANELSEKLRISEKTVRNRIKEINDELKGHGAYIRSKQKWGYLLIITDKERYDSFMIENNNPDEIPSTSDERVPFILAYLLNRIEYIKLDDLCQFMYVSRNTLSSDLKKVEYILSVYNMKLERRPNYGIRVMGNEFDKRTCLVNSFIKKNLLLDDDIINENRMKTVGHILHQVLEQQNFLISEIAFENLVKHITVSISRIKHGFYINIQEDSRHTLIDNNDIIGKHYLETAQIIADRLEREFSIIYYEEEVIYLAIHLSAKLDSNYEKTNITISTEIDEMVVEMLEYVYKITKMDFRDNMELRMALNQHMVPLLVRVKYNIPLKNPERLQIKSEYSLAYTLAATATTVINAKYHTDLNEDEICYLAIHFALAQEKIGHKIQKKNILIVCVSGKGSSQLFMYRYKEAFGKYIKHIYESTVYNLKNFDFKKNKIDYVFTTVPIEFNIPVPVFRVSLFLNRTEINTYSNMFEMGDINFLKKYYQRELFLGKIHAVSKEQVLKTMCQNIKLHYDIPDDFYDYVMLREDNGQTDFGNLTAIPHPANIVSDFNFVSVAILDKPIWWGHNDVQVVFLISLSSDKDEEIQNFYQLTTNLVFNSEGIKNIIEEPTYERLLQALQISNMK